MKCLEHALRKVKMWAEVGDLEWQGVDDPRMVNCVEIARV